MLNWTPLHKRFTSLPTGCRRQRPRSLQRSDSVNTSSLCGLGTWSVFWPGSPGETHKEQVREERDKKTTQTQGHLQPQAQAPQQCPAATAKQSSSPQLAPPTQHMGFLCSVEAAATSVTKEANGSRNRGWMMHSPNLAQWPAHCIRRDASASLRYQLQHKREATNSLTANRFNSSVIFVISCSSHNR